jgi:hypothetical protein
MGLDSHVNDPNYIYTVTAEDTVLSSAWGGFAASLYEVQ